VNKKEKLRLPKSKYPTIKRYMYLYDVLKLCPDYKLVIKNKKEQEATLFADKSKKRTMVKYRTNTATAAPTAPTSALYQLALPEYVSDGIYEFEADFERALYQYNKSTNSMREFLDTIRLEVNAASKKALEDIIHGVVDKIMSNENKMQEYEDEKSNCFFIVNTNHMQNLCKAYTDMQENMQLLHSEMAEQKLSSKSLRDVCYASEAITKAVRTMNHSISNIEARYFRYDHAIAKRKLLKNG